MISMRRPLLLLTPFAIVLGVAACGRSGVLEGGTGGGAPYPNLHGADDDDDDGTTATPTPTPFEVFLPGAAADGDLTITEDTPSPNGCRAVTLASGGDVSLADPPSFATGRVLLLQVQESGIAVSGDGADVLTPANAARWEITEITSVNGTAVTVAPPLLRRYDSDGGRTAQLCHLPQYGAVNVAAGTEFSARSWDGATGGVLAFYAQSLVLDGALDASGAGFRGGALRNSSTATSVVSENAAAGDGAGKGEGLDAESFALSGRGNLWNAGGGGNGRNGGGGGGGNGGVGGAGGKQHEGSGDVAATAGRAGARVVSDVFRLPFGGGGGAGQQNDGNGGEGGDGGGLILVIAGTISGTGFVDARGDNGETIESNDADGAGGGGAGGTILLWSAAPSSFDGVVRAGGGTGGSIADGFNNVSRRGPGGGGGGGRVFLHQLTPSTAPNILPGTNGLNPPAAGSDAWGAAAGGPGVFSPF